MNAVKNMSNRGRESMLSIHPDIAEKHVVTPADHLAAGSSSTPSLSEPAHSKATVYLLDSGVAAKQNRPANCYSKGAPPLQDADNTSLYKESIHIAPGDW